MNPFTRQSRGAHKRTDVTVEMPKHIRRVVQGAVVGGVALAMLVSTSVFGADSADEQSQLTATSTSESGPDLVAEHLIFAAEAVEDPLNGQSVIIADAEVELTSLESAITGVKPSPSPSPKPRPAAPRVNVKQSQIDRSVSYAHLSPILAEAEKYRGTPYGYAGKGPKTFDCSGFTSYVMRQLGLSIPSSSAGQRSIKGAYEVSAAEAKPGDLMWWPKTKSRSGHVAFYVAPGIQLDASTYGKPVDYRKTVRSGPKYFRISHLVP